MRAAKTIRELELLFLVDSHLSIFVVSVCPAALHNFIGILNEKETGANEILVMF